MKGGLDPVRDMELMEKLRKAVGPHINILVDANQGYPTAKDAIKWGKRMDRFDLQYLEQPVEGFDQLREVTRMLEVPVCADESCWTPTDALDIVAKHAADYISIYVTKAGGLYPARTVAKIAECAGIRCNVNGSGEFGVARRRTCTWPAAARTSTLPPSSRSPMWRAARSRRRSPPAGIWTISSPSRSSTTTAACSSPTGRVSAWRSTAKSSKNTAKPNKFPHTKNGRTFRKEKSAEAGFFDRLSRGRVICRGCSYFV